MSLPTTSIPLKVGSAPAGTLSHSPIIQLRNDSPFNTTAAGMSDAMVPDRHRGVLHRIDSQIVFHSSLDLSHIELLRCPSCLLQSELMCPRCVCSHFRINRIREQYRELFLRKAEVCRKIEDELRPKMHLQSDLHAKERSIKELKLKIEQTKENIGRLKKRTAIVDYRTKKCEKNVKTLEKKKVAHERRIETNGKEIEKLDKVLEGYQKDVFKYVRFYASFLYQYVKIERFDKKEPKTKPIDTSMTTDIVKTKSSQPQQWPPMKKYFFMINNCGIDDHTEYDLLLTDLLDGSSSLFLSKQSKHAHAALIYTISFVNTLANFMDKTLPYVFTIKDFALTTNWTQSLFTTDMYKLNTNVMAICAAFGIKSDVLKLEQPFQNVYALANMLKSNQISISDGLMTQQINHQISDQFYKFSWEERHDRYDEDNAQIEEGWVNIGFFAR